MKLKINKFILLLCIVLIGLFIIPTPTSVFACTVTVEDADSLAAWVDEMNPGAGPGEEYAKFSVRCDRLGLHKYTVQCGSFTWEFSYACKINDFCGNFLLDTHVGELCDLTAANNPIPNCNAYTCMPDTCGNRQAEEYEACDDGGLKCQDPNEVCSMCQCIKTERCGNGATGAGESCDPPGQKGNCPTAQICSADCKTCVPENLCGNNVLEPNNPKGKENCDPPDSACTVTLSDGGQEKGTCNNVCECVQTDKGTPVCGNGVKERNEDCDRGPLPAGPDPNCGSGEVCTASCQCIPARQCGNGVLEAGEHCDPGTPEMGIAPDPRNECDPTVTGDPTSLCDRTTNCLCISGQTLCGNGKIDPGEDCGEKSLTCPDAKLTCETCRCTGVCWDRYPDTQGKYGSKEECDDGKTKDCDGCNNNCTKSTWIYPEASGCEKEGLDKNLDSGQTCAYDGDPKQNPEASAKSFEVSGTTCVCKDCVPCSWGTAVVGTICRSQIEKQG